MDMTIDELSAKRLVLVNEKNEISSRLAGLSSKKWVGTESSDRKKLEKRYAQT